MSLLLGLGAIVVIALVFYRLRRTRRGRIGLVEPPHTPPTVPWRHAAGQRDAEPPRPGSER